MRKQFIHNFVDKIELLDETTEAGRHYIIPSGERLPSVTTVLSQHMDKSWLVEWKKKVGEEKAKQISAYAMRRGRAIHAIAENYILNMEYRNVIPLYVDMFESIKNVLDRSVDHIYGVELPLYSTELGTAGRTDLVGFYDGVNSIIDYKTSRRPKSEESILSYFLQSSVYALMFEKTYNIFTPQVVIIMLVENQPEATVFVRPRSLYLDQVMEIFTPGTVEG